MTPRKSRPLLWELSKNAARSPASRLRPTRAARPESGGTESPREAAPDGDAPGASAAPEFVSEIMPLLETDGFGLHMHLRWSMAAVVGMALALVVLGAFAIGRATNGAAATNSTPDNRSSGAKSPSDAPASTAKPATRGAEPPRGHPEPIRTAATAPSSESAQPENQPEPQPAKPVDSSPAPDEPQAGSAKMVAGFSYIIVQHFPKSQRPAAEKALIFLREKVGPDQHVELLAGADLRLVVMDGFDIKSENATRAKQERDRQKQWLDYIKALGGEYEKIGGYNFSKAYAQEEH